MITRLAALAAILAIALVSAVPAVAQAVTVTIGGNAVALNPGPIEQNGRVFVPLRGVFEQLGATVVYSSGQINATRGRTTVSLTIGSTQGVIDGQRVYLDVAPFIVGAYTYVPLRFLAQSLGANVNYVSSSNLVAISMPGGHAPGYAPRPNPPPVPPPAPQPAAMVTLSNRTPGAGASISNRFATISATFSRRVNASTLRVWLDGGNITGRCGLSQTGFSYKPPAPLSFGGHTIRVAGAASDRTLFDRSWSFTVAGAPPPPPTMHLTISSPGANAVVGRTFTVSGNTVANGRIRVTAGAGDAATGQFNGSTQAGPLGNFSLQVSYTPLMGQQTVRVRITATNPANGRTTQTTLQLRVR